MPLRNLRIMIEELSRDLNALEKEFARPMTPDRHKALLERIADVTLTIKAARRTLENDGNQEPASDL